MFRVTPYSAVPRKRDRNYSDVFDLFDDFFSTPRNVDRCRMDVKDFEKEYIIEAEMPGVKKEDINIHYENDHLTVSVNQEEKKEEKDQEERYIHRERSTRSFERSIYLEAVNPDQIKAKLEDGILKITAPKKEEVVNKYLVEIE
ncbi:MAG: Hsp20/alpha crystallin family protein [Candidatus Izemoplasmataceae bacterium]